VHSVVGQQVSTKRAIKFLVSAMPLVIVASLLYAALFIKPKPVGASVAKPIFERGDSFYGIAIPSAKTLWAAGSNGKVVRSGDAGTSWTLQRTPTHATLQDIAAWDVEKAVAVGNDGVVVMTRDGGRSWATINAPRSAIANKLMRVKTLPDGAAWAVGEGGVVLHSSDFGATWSLAAKEEDAAWNDVFFLDHQGWLVGEFGRIKASKNGGASWQAVNSPIKVSLMASHSRTSRPAWPWVWPALSWQHTTAASSGRCRRRQLRSTCLTSLGTVRNGWQWATTVLC